MAKFLNKACEEVLLFLFKRDINFAATVLLAMTAACAASGRFWASVGLGVLTVVVSFISAGRVEVSND